jgi:hypothetical protein
LSTENPSRKSRGHVSAAVLRALLGALEKAKLSDAGLGKFTTECRW